MLGSATVCCRWHLRRRGQVSVAQISTIKQSGCVEHIHAVIVYVCHEGRLL